MTYTDFSMSLTLYEVGRQWRLKLPRSHVTRCSSFISLRILLFLFSGITQNVLDKFS